jgi:hypothetical protein
MDLRRVPSAPAANAYTISNNRYPKGLPTGCDNTLPYSQCVRQPFGANGYSGSVNVYLDPSLVTRHNVGDSNTLTLMIEATNAFDRWNAVPARSPYLYSTNSLSKSTGYKTYPDPIGTMGTSITRDTTIGAGSWAETRTYTDFDLYGSGDQHIIRLFVVHLSLMKPLGNSGSLQPLEPGDAAIIMTHELGHGFGLGESGTPSVMYYQLDNSKSRLVPTTSSGGDVPGLQLLYNPNFCYTQRPPVVRSGGC